MRPLFSHHFSGLWLLILSLCPNVVLGQMDHDNYQHLRLQHPQFGLIDYHIDTVNRAARQPLLLWLDGSGCMPIRMIVDDGKNCCLYLSSIMIDEDSLAKRYHVVLISKPGIPYRLKDTLKVSRYETFSLSDYIEQNRSGPRCEPVFNQYNSLGWRAGAASAVLDAVLNRVKADPKRIIVAGHSEGAPVAAKTAALNPHVTHVGCFAGPGQTQFYDFTLYARQQAQAGAITPETAQKQIDTLLVALRDISRNPTATDKFWEGETYKRWASYSEPMADNLLKLTIPIYVAVGTNDKNTAAENADILPILFEQHRKSNLTYRACPGCNHWLVDTRTKTNHWTAYFNQFLALTAQSLK